MPGQPTAVVLVLCTMHKHTNRLSGETSPYLLQHAHNPVDWHPWSEEALRKAREEDKPILVSIGYAACHWCHVMERESFEDEAIAAIMNHHFINIKIDREERPDLDHIYMDALQAMEGHGGWPLNMFLTSDAKPFHGGTYFPPKPAHNRPSWEQELSGIAKAWRERRPEIMQQSEQLMQHMRNSNGFGMQAPRGFEIPVQERFTRQHTRLIAGNLLKNADLEWGGFGRAPKFPQTFSIQFLLRHHFHTGDEASLAHALHSLDCMVRGGIHDHVGGGFARYSTDREWLAPHFEKMAYDNALLVLALCDAWQVTGQVKYAETVHRTLRFVEREMTSPEGGFWSALDADSEGVEGKFYTWSLQEVEEVLGGEAGLFCELYDITGAGNWEHTNIPRLAKDLSDHARERATDPGALEERMARCRQKLLERRAGRVRPQLDDKILLGWNALMNQAFTRAYAATGEERYLRIAKRNLDFLLSAFRDDGEGRLFHAWKGVGRFPAFLDDLASLVQAMIALQEVTGDNGLLVKAGSLVEQVIRDFRDGDGPFFFYTRAQQEDVILRKKEVYDGAVPSGNALMARNLHELGILLGRPEWLEAAVSMTDSLHEAITRYPSSFGVWAGMLQDLAEGTLELVVTGPGALENARSILKRFIPNRVMQVGQQKETGFPLLEGRFSDTADCYYLCRDHTCRNLVSTKQEFIQLIELEYKR
jgi:uncharacterized protein YyaL (SSP411 family)